MCSRGTHSLKTPHRSVMDGLALSFPAAQGAGAATTRREVWRGGLETSVAQKHGAGRVTRQVL